MRARTTWCVALVACIGLSSYLAHAISEGNRRLFLPGQTTSGHHQIEERCELCHSDSFADRDTLQAACANCHADQLRESEDSHPRSKFTDPRNAARLEVLDARYCTTCHVEHRPRATGEMGLTLPSDYCAHCHADVGEERASHIGLAFVTCADAGCHNYHDNRALYEDFLVRNSAGPELLSDWAARAGEMSTARVSQLSAGSASAARSITDRSEVALRLLDVDAPESSVWRPQLGTLAGWATAVHPRAGVNCSECHSRGPDEIRSAEWSHAVPIRACAACHEQQAKEHAASRHGMRVAVGLEAMRPAQARIAMRKQAGSVSLDCDSCHGAHYFDVAFAATEACLGCHADRHSLAFEESPHARAHLAARGEERIHCATCHMPRVERPGDIVSAAHDASDNLRPNEKMLREACMQCHSLRFSLDSLADRALIENNFSGRPSGSVPSIDWAKARVESETKRVPSNPSQNGDELR